LQIEQLKNCRLQIADLNESLKQQPINLQLPNLQLPNLQSSDLQFPYLPSC